MASDLPIPEQVMLDCQKPIGGTRLDVMIQRLLQEYRTTASARDKSPLGIVSLLKVFRFQECDNKVRDQVCQEYECDH